MTSLWNVIFFIFSSRNNGCVEAWTKRRISNLDRCARANIPLMVIWNSVCACCRPNRKPYGLSWSPLDASIHHVLNTTYIYAHPYMNIYIRIQVYMNKICTVDYQNVSTHYNDLSIGCSHLIAHVSKFNSCQIHRENLNSVNT